MSEPAVEVTVVEAPPPAEPEVVVEEAPSAEEIAGAVVDRAVQIDHESRLTRVEDVAIYLGREIEDRPTREEVRSMTPDPADVAAVAAATAEAVAEEALETAVVEPAAEEVVVEEAPPAEIETVEPETPPAETSGSKRPALFRW